MYIRRQGFFFVDVHFHFSGVNAQDIAMFNGSYVEVVREAAKEFSKILHQFLHSYQQCRNDPGSISLPAFSNVTISILTILKGT